MEKVILEIWRGMAFSSSHSHRYTSTRSSVLPTFLVNSVMLIIARISSNITLHSKISPSFQSTVQFRLSWRNSLTNDIQYRWDIWKSLIKECLVSLRQAISLLTIVRWTVSVLGDFEIASRNACNNWFAEYGVWSEHVWSEFQSPWIAEGSSTHYRGIVYWLIYELLMMVVLVANRSGVVLIQTSDRYSEYQRFLEMNLPFGEIQGCLVRLDPGVVWMQKRIVDFPRQLDIAPQAATRWSQTLVSSSPHLPTFSAPAFAWT